MIERHTFVDILEVVKEYSNNVRQLEKTLDCHFENWVTKHESNMIYHLSRAFFDTEDIRNIDWECNTDDVVEQQQEVIEDLILFYCYTGEFGSKKETLVDIYERKGMKMNGTTADSIYDIIVDYLQNTQDDVTFNFS